MQRKRFWFFGDPLRNLRREPGLALIRRIAGIAAAFACTANLATAANAGQGITSSSITLVQTADLTGSRSALVRELNAGSEAYFAYINGQGGIYGRQIDFRTEDDGYDVANTKKIVEEYIARDAAFAFMSFIGTANAEAAIPSITAAKVPLIAPLSGAASFRSMHNRYVFNIRASYAAEVRKMVEHLSTIGIRRVAIFYDDDSFGQDVKIAAEQALSLFKLELVASGKVARGSKDVSAAVRDISAAKPQAVICGSFGASLVEFVREMKQSETHPQYYALSFFPVGASIKELGIQARGIGVTQVMPKPTALDIRVVQEFHKIMNLFAAKNAPRTPLSIEGFITAKVIVEGLKAAGPRPTRESFIHALENLPKKGADTVFPAFTERDHIGLRYVDISVIGRDGRVLH